MSIKIMAKTVKIMRKASDDVKVSPRPAPSLSVVQHPLNLVTVVQEILTYLIVKDDSGFIDIMDKSMQNYQRLGSPWYELIDSKIHQVIPFKLRTFRSIASVDKALQDLKSNQFRFEASIMPSDAMTHFCQRVGHQMTSLDLKLLIQNVHQLIANAIRILSQFCKNLKTLTLTCNSERWYEEEKPESSGNVTGQNSLAYSLSVSNLEIKSCFVDGCADIVGQVIKACPDLKYLTLAETSSEMVMTLLNLIVIGNRWGQLKGLRIRQMEDLEVYQTKVWRQGQWEVTTEPSPESECASFLNFFQATHWHIEHFELCTGRGTSLSATFLCDLLEHLAMCECLFSLRLDLDFVHYDPSVDLTEQVIVPISFSKLKRLTVIGHVTTAALLLVDCLQMPNLKFCHVAYTGKLGVDFGELWGQVDQGSMTVALIETLHLDNSSLSTVGGNKHGKFVGSQVDLYNCPSLFQQVPNPWVHLKELEISHVSHLTLKEMLNAEINLERLHVNGLYVAISESEVEPLVDWDEIFVGIKKSQVNQVKGQLETAEPSIANMTDLKSLKLTRNGALTDFFLTWGLMKLNNLQSVSIQNNRFSSDAVAVLQTHVHAICRLNF